MSISSCVVAGRAVYLFLCFSAVTALATQDAPSKQAIQEIIEKLRSDSPEVRARAVQSLVELGPSAIRLIQEARTGADAETRARLDEALRRIKKNEKLKIIGRPVLVNLSSEGEKLPRLVEQLAKQTGQPVEVLGLSTTRLSVSLEQEPFWRALDRICGEIGAAEWWVDGESRILIRRPDGFENDLARVIQGNVFVGYRGCSLSATDFQMEFSVVALRGVSPAFADLRIEELVDNTGARLGKPYEGRLISNMTEPVTKGAPPLFVIRSSFSVEGYRPRLSESERFTSLKGAVQLTYVLTTRPLITIRDLTTVKLERHRAGDLSFRFLPLRTEGKHLKTWCAVEGPGDLEATVQELSFDWVDKKGTRHRGRRLGTGAEFPIYWTLPEGVQLERLEIRAPERTATLKVPFEFRNAPLFQ